MAFAQCSTHFVANTSSPSALHGEQTPAGYLPAMQPTRSHDTNKPRPHIFFNNLGRQPYRSLEVVLAVLASTSHPRTRLVECGPESQHHLSFQLNGPLSSSEVIRQVYFKFQLELSRLTTAQNRSCSGWLAYGFFDSLVRRIKVRPTPVKEAPRLRIFTNTSTSASTSLRRWIDLLASWRGRAHASRSSAGAIAQRNREARDGRNWPC